VSILEVLFAIAVTTIGLLGAIAVFPVASAQARKGRISDAMAVAGMSAAHDFDVRGMRKAANWVAFDSGGNAISPYTQQQNNIATWFNGNQTFCLDPRYLAANASQRDKARWFPANTANSMNRITLPGEDVVPANRWMKAAVAEAIFMFDDDLTFGRPDDRSQNAYQVIDRIGTIDYKRQSDGHMSWMATITPKFDRLNDSFKDNYVLSIVVFYDRPMDQLTAASPNSTSEHSFTIGSGTTNFPGGGITGGEVLLGGSSDPLNRIKANDWILLTAMTVGTPESTMPPAPATLARPVAKWYRVMDVDAEVDTAASTTRHVTLFGQDWDTSLNTNAVYVEGVVGVYEKTIRLDMTP